MGKKKVNMAHFLLGSRFSSWMKLLKQNDFKIRKESRGQAALITATSLFLSVPGTVERILYKKRIEETKIEKDPIYIMGFWRTGTTFMQYLFSRDPQFGWLDPVGSATISNCILMRKFLTRAQSKVLGTARPMDNMEYSVDFPMEDAFSQATFSDLAVIHMMAFPQNYKRYIPCAFIQDLPEKERARWHREYAYILKKNTFIQGGKQMLLKSPDNTAHPADIIQDYPNAKFICLCRDPYVTAMSTVHMFTKQMEILALQDKPGPDFDNLIEDVVLEIMERMYREYFEYEKTLPRNQSMIVIYEDYTKDPLNYTRKIYEQLEIPGFEEALPHMEKYVRSQEGYVKNKFTLSKRFCDKINSRLGFYFDYCGYEKREVND
ncbi:MAG: sulfotransferase [Oscillospiraceae bacterium]|nr:sulfotransferase [Oscillospiraceae bacterium]